MDAEKLIQDGREHDFYVSSQWQRLRAEILAADKYECQECKKRGRYARAEIVHHVNHLKDRPDLALVKVVDSERNLISVCRECHETVCHPERMRKHKKPLTEEKW